MAKTKRAGSRPSPAFGPRPTTTEEGNGQAPEFELATETETTEARRETRTGRTAYAGRSTFTLPLSEGGDAIGVDLLTEAKRTRLRKLLADPRMADVLPGVGHAIGQAETMDADACGYLYDAIGLVSVTIARARGVPEEAAGVLLFTEDEKKALADPTAKVLSKYVGNFKYQDELLLGMILIATINAKVNAMNQALKRMTPAPPEALTA